MRVDDRIRKTVVFIGLVYLAGMFVSHIGENSNLPILRIGTIASMPAERIQTQYGHHEAFLIEARSIDGLSGSPVCVHMTPDRAIPSIQAGLIADPRYQPPPPPTYFLAGMILGYNAVYNPRDTIEIKGRAESPDVIEAAVPLNTGIAVVLPIWRIIEAINQPLIRERREAVLKASNREKGRGFVATSAAPLAMPTQIQPQRRRQRKAK